MESETSHSRPQTPSRLSATEAENVLSKHEYSLRSLGTHFENLSAEVGSMRAQQVRTDNMMLEIREMMARLTSAPTFKQDPKAPDVEKYSGDKKSSVTSW